MNTIEFNKKLICGPEFVAVRIIENCEDLKVGNIWLNQNADANSRLAHCKIEDIGEIAAEKYGIKVGDYVLIDRLATFAHTAPVAALKYDSVICITNEKNDDWWPLKDMIFIEPDNKDEVSNVGGIYVSGYENRLNTGTITKMNIADTKFKVGDKVLLTKGSDKIKFGNVLIHVYKKDMIVAKIED